MIQITASTKLVCLLGHPVSHSFSPAMHNAVFASLGLDYVYTAFDVNEGSLESAVKAIPALGMRGANVTIPYKQAVIPLMDTLDPEAELIGAVNTIVNDDGRLIGYNTDGAGFVQSLEQEAGVDPSGKNVIIIGAGGACRAVAVSLALHGASKVAIANRTTDKAEDIARAINNVIPGAASASSLEKASLDRILKHAHILVHTTPIGMHPHVEAEPVVDPRLLPPGLLVCDLIYNPGQTKLLTLARAQGCRTLSGIGMLVYQGAEAFRLWTGLSAPAGLMRRALEDQLKALL